MLAADRVHVAIVGAGAAGLATAIFTRRANPDLRVMVIDGARAPGAKILVSGGSRCNVTNAIVTAADFNGGRPGSIARVLRALPVEDTVTFFRRIGVPLHEEADGKLFPDSNRSRDVLQALLAETEAAGAELRTGSRVNGIERERIGFRLNTAAGVVYARSVVLATGGLSLPKTGSDGAGYRFAAHLGHVIVPTTPALAPLVLSSGDNVHQSLSGVAQPVRLDLREAGRIIVRIRGSLLWTHFGVSGPAALDLSRHWLRAGLAQRPVEVTASFAPADQFEALDASWLALANARPRLAIQTALGARVPGAVAGVLLTRASIDPQRTLAALTRAERRTLNHCLLEWPLSVTGSRGYTYAEATAGGVALDEVSPSTLESRLCPGLHLVGEILDVDGRLGGFNFQWAWSSARVAATALARQVQDPID